MLARVAELADAQDLKSCCGDTVPVRFRSRALKKETVVFFFFMPEIRKAHFHCCDVPFVNSPILLLPLLLSLHMEQ